MKPKPAPGASARTLAQICAKVTDSYLTPEEASAYLKIERRQLQRCGVPHLVFSHKIRRYRQSDLDAWASARRAA